jgi:hypothetical protein
VTVGSKIQGPLFDADTSESNCSSMKRWTVRNLYLMFVLVISSLLLPSSGAMAKDKRGGVGMTPRQEPLPNPSRPVFDIGRTCTGNSAPECASLCTNCFGKILIDKVKVAVLGEKEAACMDAAMSMREGSIGESVCGAIECIGSDKATSLGLGNLVAACKGGKLAAQGIQCVSDYFACQNAIVNEDPVKISNECSLNPSVAKCKASGAKTDGDLYNECLAVLTQPGRTVKPNELGACVRECIQNSKTFNSSPCLSIEPTGPTHRND